MKKQPIEILRRLYRDRFKKNAAGGAHARGDEAGIVEQLKKDGIVILENYFPEDFCDEMIAFIDAYIAKNGADLASVQEKVRNIKEFKFGVPQADGSSFWADAAGSDIRIIHAEAVQARLKKEFFENEAFKRIGEAMLGNALTRNFTMANRTTFKEQNLGSGGGWHRDNNYSHGFKALVYLQTVSEKNGPFEYLKTTFSLRNHLLHFPYPDKYQFTNEEVQSFISRHPKQHLKVTGTKGTLVMFNTNGIHRGMPLQEGTRYALTNYYK